MISIKEGLSSLDPLEQLLQQANAQTATAVKGLTAAAANYLLANTSEWSGDMVAQWRIVPLGETVTYQESPFKHYPWEELIEEGPYSVADPNRAALNYAAARMQTDMGRISRSATTQWSDWMNGVSIVNPHPMQAILLNGTSRFRHPLALDQMVLLYLQTKFAAFPNQMRLLGSLRQQHIQPERLTTNVRKGAKDRAIAKALRSQAFNRSRQAQVARTREDRNARRREERKRNSATRQSISRVVRTTVARVPLGLGLAAQLRAIRNQKR